MQYNNSVYSRLSWTVSDEWSLSTREDKALSSLALDMVVYRFALIDLRSQMSYNTRHKSLKQEPFVLIFFQISFIHSSHLCSHSSVPPLLPQCWAERILEHWNDCKPKSTLGMGKSHKCFKIRDEDCRHVGYPRGLLCIMVHTGRLRPKGVSFSGFRYMKG